MSAGYSSALLRSPLLNRAPSDAKRVHGFLKGTIETVTAPSLPLVGGTAVPRSMRPNGFKHRQALAGKRAERWGVKRQMGGDGKLPNDIRCWFTEGERAVLAVIGRYVKKYGCCELSVEGLAREAGVGMRTVQYTLALARGGRARIGRRAEPPSRPVLIHVAYRRPRGSAFNDTNVITIVSREWLLWLNYRPSERPDTGCTEVQPNSIRTFNPLSTRENDSPYAAVERSYGLGNGAERTLHAVRDG